MTAAPISNPVDFKRVEAVRLHMRLRQADMAHLFGVSRLTYVRWVQGYAARESSQKIVRARLRELLGIARDGFPRPETMALKPEERYKQLLALLE